MNPEEAKKELSRFITDTILLRRAHEEILEIIENARLMYRAYQTNYLRVFFYFWYSEGAEDAPITDFAEIPVVKKIAFIKATEDLKLKTAEELLK